MNTIWGDYRPDDDDDDEDEDEEIEAARRKKKIPGWARGQVLLRQLEGQRDVDPDEVFRPHLKTCSLDEVFKLQGKTSPPNTASPQRFPLSTANCSMPLANKSTQQLEGQQDVSPDEVFRPHLKSCSLDEVYKLQGTTSPSKLFTAMRLCYSHHYLYVRFLGC